MGGDTGVFTPAMPVDGNHVMFVATVAEGRDVPGEGAWTADFQLSDDGENWTSEQTWGPLGAGSITLTPTNEITAAYFRMNVGYDADAVVILGIDAHFSDQ